MEGTQVAIKSMQELMLEELREIYSAERLALRAYPRMRKVIRTQSLRDAVERHVEQTKEQTGRLEQMFELMDARTRAKTCRSMQGLLEEAQEHIDADLSPELLEVMLVSDLQKIEHFEIAAYGSAKAHAQALGLQEAAKLLDQTLNEEKETDTILNQIATKEVNPQAVGESEEAEEVIDTEEEKPRKRAAPSKSKGTSGGRQPVAASPSKAGPRSRGAKNSSRGTGAQARS
jgi:ferritin-like metal-binding protein YciE